MTATAYPGGVPHTGGSKASRLIRAEYLKIRTTNIWWLFTIGVAVLAAIALTWNIALAHFFLHADPASIRDNGAGPDSAAAQAQFDLLHKAETQAAIIFTSGQFFGGMFAMLLAILLITNEYFHQTATTTFLTTPRRTAVVLAKFVTAMLAAAVFWLLTTVLSLAAGIIFFQLDGTPNHLGDWSVQHAILVNLMVFALWGVFGLGFGVLLRSQLAATITATLLYLLGTFIAGIIFQVIRTFWIKHDWVLTAQVILPNEAATIATAATKAYPQAAPWWVGVLVLIGYGLVTGVIGTLIMRKRDIS